MRLERFGEHEFSTISAEDDFRSTVAPSDFVNTTAGAFDPHVGYESGVDPHVIPRRHEIFGTSPEDLQTKLDAAMALRGKRLKLYGRTYEGDVRWTWARCVAVNRLRTNRNFYYQEVECMFEVASGPWEGSKYTEWAFDAGYNFDDGLLFDTDSHLGFYINFTDNDGNITKTTNQTGVWVPIDQDAGNAYTCTGYGLKNSGNAPITDAIITIEAGGEITFFAMSFGWQHEDGSVQYVSELRYNGTVPAGSTIVIDCGANSVLLDGVDAYDNFELGSTHNNENWMQVEPNPGTTILPVAYCQIGDQPGGRIKIEYADGWK